MRSLLRFNAKMLNLAPFGRTFFDRINGIYLIFLLSCRQAGRSYILIILYILSKKEISLLFGQW
jgi:hypothetical protein